MTPGTQVEKGSLENGTYELGFVLEVPEGQAEKALVCWLQPYGSITRLEPVEELRGLEKEKA